MFNVKETTNFHNDLELLSELLSKTLGPYGRTVIIEDPLLKHKITKDGYSVLKALDTKDPDDSILLQMIKNISYNLVRKVGDGSTTAVVASNSLYGYIRGILDNTTLPPQDVLNHLNFISSIICDKLYEKSKPCETGDVYNIALTSTNGDSAVSSLIQEVYSKVGKEGLVKIEYNPDTFDRFSLNTGMEIFRGFADPVFVNEHDEKVFACSLRHANVFMCDDQLGAIELVKFNNIIKEFYTTSGKSSKIKSDRLVIIANSFDKVFLDYFIELRKKNPELGLCLVDFATNSEDQLNRFKDLAIYLGCSPHFKRTIGDIPEYVVEMLGYCDQFSATETRTSFIGGGGSPELLEERIKDTNEELEFLLKQDDFLDRSTKITKLKNRIASMSSSVATIYVGGTTEQEKVTRKYLIEDAVFACSSALKHGINIGGSLAIPKLIASLSGDEIQTIYQSFSEKFTNIPKLDVCGFVDDILAGISNAFEKVFYKVLANANGNHPANIDDYLTIPDIIFNLRTGKFETFGEPKVFNRFEEGSYMMESTSIVNSVETDVEVLRSCVSIIGLIANSAAMVLIPRYR